MVACGGGGENRGKWLHFLGKVNKGNNGKNINSGGHEGAGVC